MPCDPHVLGGWGGLVSWLPQVLGRPMLQGPLCPGDADAFIAGRRQYINYHGPRWGAPWGRCQLTGRWARRRPNVDDRALATICGPSSGDSTLPAKRCGLPASTLAKAHLPRSSCSVVLRPTFSGTSRPANGLLRQRVVELSGPAAKRALRGRLARRECCEKTPFSGQFIVQIDYDASVDSGLADGERNEISGAESARFMT